MTNIKWFLFNTQPPSTDAPKKRVVLLGDGFLARGFLHHINRQKFHITQIYKDPFINPQDVVTALAKEKCYTKNKHLRDYFHSPADFRLSVELKEQDLNLARPSILNHGYDYLVVGLGAHKSLKSWTDDINSLVNLRGGTIDIVGMGPVGLEIGTILGLKNKVHLYDSLVKGETLTYLSPVYKRFVENHLVKHGIVTTYGQMYKESGGGSNKVLFCVGNRPNAISGRFTVDANLRHVNYPHIFIGGDGANTPHLKTGQAAYQQGAYIAHQLNGSLPEHEPFVYKDNGIALNIGDNKVVIEGHPVMPTGIYPAFITRLYSLLFV